MMHVEHHLFAVRIIIIMINNYYEYIVNNKVT